MNARAGIVPVLAAPMLDPGRDRISIDAPHGLTIDEIIALALPDRGIAKEYIRVALVTPQGSQIVPPAVWHVARPNAGVHVVIRIIPGKSVFKSILQIVVAIAAVAIGSFFAPALAGALGISQGLAQGIITLGATVVGNLLINALIPPPKPEDQDQENRYTISGWKNRVDLDGAVPFPVGTIRYAPPFAALSYSEIVGDFLYIRSFFNFGYGRQSLTDFRIGDTSLAEYDEVDIHPLEGLETDGPATLFPRQVIEESVGAELTRPYPRDDLGEIIDDSEPEETPVTRTTGPDASGASVILAWPAGLFRSNDEGRLRNNTVVVDILQRQVQAEEWELVETLTVTARQREAFYRQHTWNFATRGRYQIRCVMKTAETTSLQRSQKTAWAALQTLRSEYPLNFDAPLALVALRIKATHQLNGQLDNFNALTSRFCLDYDYTDQTWKMRETSNPASIFRLVLQHEANPRPVPDAGIDLAMLADWHNFCRLKGLKFDRVFDDPGMSLGDALTEIAAAGRASKRHDGIRWGVVIDRPQELVVDHFSPRNSFGFKATRSYVRYPDGMRVKFLDATNDYKPTERLVPWPGHVGEIKLTEAIEHPGKTDPDEIFRETRRRMLETIHRPDAYRLSLDTPLSSATRGDRVAVSQDILDRTQVVGRANSVTGNLIELDERVMMEAGNAYAVRFRLFANPNDTIGTSVVRPVINAGEETSVIIVEGEGAMPQAGSLVHFGIAGSESYSLVVSGIEAGQDMSMHYKLIDASPVIDQIIDEMEIPAWSGRIGAEIDENLLTPSVPFFKQITSGISGTDVSGQIDFLIEVGPGSVPVTRFKIEHKRQAASSWTTFTIPVANGGGSLAGYANGDTVQIRGSALSADGIASATTNIITFTVGSKDAAIPPALDASMITVGALLGGAVVQFATSEDLNVAQVQIFRSQSANLNRETDKVGAPIVVEPSRSYSQGVGDTTRQNLITNGGFDTATGWTLGSGWTIASGKASKASGAATAITQGRATSAGKFYRASFVLSSVTAGSVTPLLTGGTTRAGVARSANGTFTDRIQAVTGNNTVGLSATATFVGSLDDVAVYLETTTCLAQGNHNIWLETQNAEGVPGPIVGPFSVTIR